MAAKDYYTLLGVRSDAGEKEIKNAFHQAALRWHPDKNDDDPVAEKRFKDVSAAYEVLKNPKKRYEYDLSLRSDTQEAIFYRYNRKHRGCGCGGRRGRGCSKPFSNRQWTNEAPRSIAQEIVDVTVEPIEAMLGCEVKFPFESILGRTMLAFQLPSGLSEGDIIRTEMNAALHFSGLSNPLYLRIHITA